MARVEIDYAAARNLSMNLATRLVQDTTSAVLKDAKNRIRTFRYDTGRLYRSGRTRIRSYTYRIIGTVSFNAPHALLVHKGAKPHLIRPVRKTGMLFYWPAGVGSPPLSRGRYVCFKGTVHHPGFRGMRYLTIPLLIEASKRRFRVEVSGGSGF